MNQSYDSHGLFYAPVNRSLVLAVDDNGNPAGKYKKMHRGVKFLVPEKHAFISLLPMLLPYRFLFSAWSL